jgi:hypothetical protein
MRWMGHIARMDEIRIACNIFVGNQWKKQHCTRRHAWENDFKLDGMKTECEEVDWVHLAADKVQ